MAHLRIKGLILRANPANERDRYVRLLTAEQGLIEAYARGALRPKSPLLAATESFGFCDFTLFTTREKFYVDQVSFIYPFAGIKADVDLQTVAAHLGDLALDAAQSLESAQELYTVMLYAYYALERAGEDRAAALAVAHAGELRILALSGYRLSFEACPHCARAPEAIEGLRFDFGAMRFLCARGAGAQGARGDAPPQAPPSPYARAAHPDADYLGRRIWPVSPALLEALRYFTEEDIRRVFSFRLQPRLESELAAFTKALLAASFEKDYRRLDYLRSLVSP